MKQKNKPKVQDSLNDNAREEKNKKSMFEKFLDVSIVVLIVLIVFLGVRIFAKSDYYEKARSKVYERLNLLKDNKVTESPVGNKTSSSRKYPEYVTEEERIVLRAQSGDQTPDDARRWSELVRKLATSSNTLSLKKYNEDCFGVPSVLKLNSDQKVEIVNDNDSDVTLGYGEKSWRVPAKGRLSVKFDISRPEKGGDDVFGYGCGNSNEPSGLVLIEF